MTHLGLSQQDFAAQLNLSPASISNIFNGRTNPTIMHVKAIHNAFPQINEKWLLFGEGEMIEGENVTPSPIGEITIMDDDEDGSSFGNLFEQKETVAPAVSSPTSERGQQGVGNRSRQRSVNSYEEQAKRAAKMTSETEMEIIKNSDKKLRRVKEIRVFYDDNTYETFVPAVK